MAALRAIRLRMRPVLAPYHCCRTRCTITWDGVDRWGMP